MQLLKHLFPNGLVSLTSIKRSVMASQDGSHTLSLGPKIVESGLDASVVCPAQSNLFSSVRS